MPALNCITPKCLSKPYRRGLCIRCYGQAKKLVADGKTTWDALEGMGLAKPDLDPFTSAFEERSNATGHQTDP